MSVRPRDERGAIVVVFAVCLVFVLIPLTALAVDLGNAFQRRREVQSQADLAALAGGAGLPDHSTALNYVAGNLGHNKKIGQVSTAAVLRTTSLNDPLCALRVDGKATVWFINANRVKVCAPGAKVDFGFAGAMGLPDSKTVTAEATVSAGTPGASAEMPFFGVANGCDYGSHLLSQPANVSFDTVSPPNPLALPVTDGANPQQTMTLTGLPTPTYVAQDAVGPAAKITISGKGLASVSRIAFLRSTTLTPQAIEIDKTTSPYTASNGTIDGIIVPPSVTSQPGVWWMRVYKPATTTSGSTAQEKKDGWSKETTGGGSVNMVPLQVGLDVLSCDGKSDGNFGTLKLPRTSAPSEWVSRNTAQGLESPLSLHVLAGASPASPYCSAGASGVVVSTATSLQAGTNCVDTDTGLTANDATTGLITGGSGYSGRLDKDTTTGILQDLGRNGNCGVNKTSSRTSPFGSYLINNDVLSCFMKTGSAPLSTITSSSCTGACVGALDSSIFRSPRFCYAPVLGTKATSGGSNMYGIVDVRPCFITGESPTSSYDAQSTLDTTNGLKTSNNRVSSIRVIFFNRDALPAYGPNVGDYIGVGTPAVQLVK
jgi:hypothetical protein